VYKVSGGNGEPLLVMPLAAPLAQFVKLARNPK